MWVSVVLRFAALILIASPGAYSFIPQSGLPDGCVANARIFGGTIKGGMVYVDKSKDQQKQLDECVQHCQSFSGCSSVSLNKAGQCKAKPHDMTMDNQELNDKWVTCHRDAYKTQDACIGVECLNEGACLDGECRCAEGFSGESCEIDNRDPCIGVVCQNGGKCTDGNCQCAEGFHGDNCETRADPCDGVVCQNGGTCSEGSCYCADGFEGTNCETKSAVHEWGFIESKSMPGMCIDVKGLPGLKDGANVQLWKCETDIPLVTDQLWKISGNGHIISRPSGKCLDLLGMCNKLGLTRIQIHSCETTGNFWGSTDHYWNLKYHNDEFFRIENRCTGKCADVDGWSRADNGRTIHQWACEEFDTMGGGGWGKPVRPSDHWWKFVPVDLCAGVQCRNGGTCVEGVCNCVDGFEGDNCEITSVVHKWGFIESYSMPGMCIDVDGAPGTRDGANVQLWSCEKHMPQTSDQIWDIMDNGHIVNRPSGKCLDLAGMCNKMGATRIQIHTCENQGYRNFWGQTDHFWRKRYHDSTYFRLENVCTGKCADVDGWSKAENGKTIHQWGCEEWGTMGGGSWGKRKSQTDHWWKFVPVDL